MFELIIEILYIHKHFYYNTSKTLWQHHEPDGENVVLQGETYSKAVLHPL